jgi:hypothetical protein
VTIYAAYGSNLDPAQMAERCPHSPLQGTGWLLGWRLTFGGEEHGWDGSMPTIAEGPGEQVFVALYDVTEADEKTLDAWEGTDLQLYNDRLALRAGRVRGRSPVGAHHRNTGRRGRGCRRSERLRAGDPCAALP